MATRISKAGKDSFSIQFPLLLNWNGKFLPYISGTKEIVDRITVIDIANGVEKLLAIPKVGKGTGEEQAAACTKTLDDWGGFTTEFRVLCSTRLPPTWASTEEHVYSLRNLLDMS